MKYRYIRNILLISISTFLITNICEARNFGGWGASTGSLIITGNMTGVPNPDKKPTIVQFSGMLDEISILCDNPGGNADPAEGVPHTEQSVVENQQISDDNVEGKGQGNFEIVISTAQYENTLNCPGNGWLPVTDSAIVYSFHGTLEWLECNGDGIDPCFDSEGHPTVKPKPYDTLDIWCDAPADLVRNPDGTAPDGVEYECTDSRS